MAGVAIAGAEDEASDDGGEAGGGAVVVVSAQEAQGVERSSQLHLTWRCVLAIITPWFFINNRLNQLSFVKSI